MHSSRKPDSGIFRIVQTALQAADATSPTLELPRLALAQVAQELGRLRELAMQDSQQRHQPGRSLDRRAAAADSPGGAPEWLNASEATRYLGLPSCKALYQAVRRGQVPMHRFGARRMRFRRLELDSILERGRQASALECD
jgi:hypothetical protein